MRTFDARLSRASFWTVLVAPPAIFLLIVQGWANGIEHGELSVRSTLFIMALAQLIPLGALVWMLLSTAAYSVGGGKLVVHSVMADREFSLSALSEPPQLRGEVIMLRLPRRILVRVEQPQACWSEIVEAAGLS
jgi:hypothetical protein